MPYIDTSEFEDEMGESQRIEFEIHRDNFILLIRNIIDELGLAEHIELVKVYSPAGGHAALWRENSDEWPSPKLNLDIYTDKNRYLCANLIRHEFGHEADRHNSEMHYEPAIEKRWMNGPNWNLFHLIVNISLDSRLAEQGLGKAERRREFDQVRKEHPEFFEGQPNFFEDTWNNPPSTWPAIEALTRKLTESKAK